LLLWNWAKGVGVATAASKMASVGECALRARLTGLQFVAQVAAVANLVEVLANHFRATRPRR
jgi:hypothetical protein